MATLVFGCPRCQVQFRANRAPRAGKWFPCGLVVAFLKTLSAPTDREPTAKAEALD
jgi:hypothetical protein